MKKQGLMVLVLSLLIGGPAFAQEEADVTVKINSEYTYRMLDHTTDINQKQLLLLRMREQGLLQNGQMYIGADMNVIADYQDSNTEAKFGYLMRHPTRANQSGTSVSELVIHDAKLQVTGTVTPWATLHFHVLYNPEQSFGSGSITDLERNQLSLRRGYILIGDLSKSPFYASLGKMATPFGLTDTVSPFSSSTIWHAFGGLAYGGLVGYDRNGLNLSFMGIQGGAQFRAANSGDDTPDDVANFTVNGSYELDFAEDASIKLGGGYADGSAYCQGFPVTHFDECEESNPAYNIYSVLKTKSLKVLAEYTKTKNDWPGTHNPNPPLDVFEASDVSAFTVGARYLLPIKPFDKELSVSAEFSKFEAGASGSPWEDQSQFVVGLELQVNPHAKIFAEYIHTDGYVPLNFISGPDPSDPAMNPGTTHSEADAESDVFLMGMRLGI